jgi:hypothetical protein
MNYRTRLLERQLQAAAQFFKIVLLVGARQVGKSSLLGHLFPEVKSFVFDPVQDLYNARRDPDLFLQSFPAPLILDEIQYVPELLPALKRIVDQHGASSQYLITGSQQFSVLRSITESLAGRVAIIQLDPMTPHEIYGSGKPCQWLSSYLTDPSTLLKKFAGVLPQMPSLYEVVWRGCMPGTIDLPNQLLPTYFSSYIQTYVERDIRLLENIQDVGLFTRFFSLLGALSAQEINYAQLGRELGITPTTARRWLDLLGSSYQWHELWPYHGNTIKRISSKAKGYASDTGIACYLQRISSPEALSVSPGFGALFETYCVNMIRTLCAALPGTPPKLYHWRTAAGAELDLLLELDGKLYPIEIKAKTTITGHDLSGMRAFRQTYKDAAVMAGIVLYAGKECYLLDQHTIAVPWNAL